jgi:hypothetical protein
MTLSIILDEEDLRALPANIREPLLRWYFDSRAAKAPAASPQVQPQPVPSSPTPPTADDDSRRVTFKKLVTAGLLKTGEEIHCRTLKRQQRAGKPKYITGAKVTPNGAVEFNGEEFQNPSNLAVAMVKQSGGKPTALNGFDYLFVRSGGSLVPLKSLRDLLARAQAAVRDYKEISGQDSEPQDHVPHVRRLES